jgi:RNA polymerase sigma factor (sigma-70 family)
METGEVDQHLLSFLRAPDESESSRLLEQLISNHAEPVIREIIYSKLHVHPSFPGHLNEAEDSEDVAAEVVLRLVGRLQALKNCPASNPINNLRSYVARMTYNACDEYLRRKYPKRYSLKNQLRYVLTHQEGLALWEGDDKRWLCGFDAWRGVDRQARRARHLEGITAQRSDPARQLADIFEQAGGPVELEELVGVVARIWGVKDEPPVVADELSAHQLADTADSLDAVIDRRAFVARIWEEICRLPVNQRVALMLSLRDQTGRAVVTLLPLIRVASMRRIADALEIDAQQLARIWGELPLEDARIAESLGVTRQQVINLRKSARERLSRRTKEFR